MSASAIHLPASAFSRRLIALAAAGMLLLAVTWGLLGVLPWPSAAFFYGIPAVADESPETAQRWLQVRDWNISEASGMAMSGRHGGCVWLHNDSGDDPRLFLVGDSGATRAVLRLEGIEATDWEDMCAFRSGDTHWLLVGDFGDNSANRGVARPGCRLWLFPEPELPLPPANAQPLQHTLRPALEVRLTWPEGARDCESVAVDVAGGQILLCTKAKASAAAIHRIPLDLQTKVQVREARQLCRLAVPYATAMDISPDGRRLAIVNPLSGLLFEKSAVQTWTEVLTAPPQILTLPPRAQGETACFAGDSETLLVGSEGRWQAVWKVRLPTTGGKSAPESR
ncbi:MAG: hypothetical protein ACKO2P_10680 [Planctomycetota bacterium]